MPRIVVIGGGLAGLAAATALGEQGYAVDLLEARPYLGGRAASYGLPDGSLIDNCQHVLLRCCVNLMDLYRRLGVAGQITFHREFHFVEPGGRVSTMRRGILPPPGHFAGSFLNMRCFGWRDKVAIARAILAVDGAAKRADLDSITMLDWLREQGQPRVAIERFWRQILVSAINEELDGMAARHGLQVFRLGFLANRDSYEMGLAGGRLGDLYSVAPRNVTVHERCAAEPLLEPGIVRAGGREFPADFIVCAVPFERAPLVLPGLPVNFDRWDHSPITGIHLWFDRPVTSLPHATLLDRTIQWMFNKDGGRYVQLVVSASRSLTPLGRNEVVDLALRELAEFFPEVERARLEKAHVVKEVRATYSARPGLRRPGVETHLPGVFLAGDWIDTGWPATMEGAVRGGYLAAEAVTKAAGQPRRFVLPDIA